MTIERIIYKIKKGDGLFYGTLNKVIKSIRDFEVPVIKPLHIFFFYERKLRRELFMVLLRKVYFEPLFKVKCFRYGSRLRLIQSLPLIIGNVHLYVGNDVVIDGYNTFESTAVFEKPVLRIGDNVFIGYHVSISVGREVVIGNHCFIAGGVSIFDNDGHPVNHIRRAKHERVSPDKIMPVRIGDYVWIGTNATILKGVTIGEGAIIGAGSVVTKDVPSFVIAAGNPARIIARVPLNGSNPQLIGSELDRQTLSDNIT